MSSVLPLSFSWGFNPKFELEDSNTKENESESHQQVSSVQAPSFKPDMACLPKFTTHTTLHSISTSSSKRRYQEDTEPVQTNNYTTGTTPRRSAIGNLSMIRKPVRKSSMKKSRSINRIQGQQLPPSRLIESLDHESLQKLLNSLISTHPEITESLYKCAPRPTVASCIEILQSKVELIISQLPYKVDAGSEYAYLRVKPYIDDFLHALSDYTLNFLTPVETTPANSLDFLDQATALLHKLPTFNKASDNYFSDMAYEQLGHTWLDSLKEFIKSTEDDGSGIYVLINQGWEARLRGHSEGSRGRLSNVNEWFANEVRELQDSPAKKFNFSMGNSPIVRGFQGNGNLLQGHTFR
ncbi:hypothetical protein WICPIJ_004650 [Wickerhamomyces pijperi]|uniref:Tethering factor for nuclear proteasome STS1 n=1 Tax=Wickerhamomyces pijperi TaxID=599730 RepID=A0A9P8Q7P5_WICPI|nr:hypothetical protein WICPIJ_004650 [Wickerhamomyces pijperi]